MLRPDPEQDEVCRSTARHLVVTAPPGTGKTHLTVRLAGQLAPSLPPGSQVLVLTFSNQARTQLERQAAIQLSPQVRRAVEISNYHSFFWKSVSAYRRCLGLPMELDIGSRTRRLKALARGVGRRTLKDIDAGPGLLESLAEHQFSVFRDWRTPPRELLQKLLESVEAEQKAGRLVFDDLGALFWRLIESFPTVDRAYQAHFPVVIADEHQDASALQDAVVRRMGTQRLVVLADSMQLIHGFRGAHPSRLDRHEAECDEKKSLSTTHRWHGAPHLGNWLIAVRRRLLGETTAVHAPEELRLVGTDRKHGFGAIKAQVKYALQRARQQRTKSAAVLATTNGQVAELRSYLCRAGFRPRQIGSADFEDARIDIEQLPLLRDPQNVALHAVDRIGELIPTLRQTALKQARGRLEPARVNLSRAGTDARIILEPLQLLYEGGNQLYFQAVVEVVAAAQRAGHHAPRMEALEALRRTSEALSDQPVGIEDATLQYARDAVAAANSAPRTRRGLFVMTTHQAKGKEFDLVILADASDRFFPDTSEARRLFYVAITRATSGWVVVAPSSGASPLISHLGRTM